MNLYICKPYPKHLREKFPKGLTHQVHKWSMGIILVDHTEPDGTTAIEHHKNYIILRIRWPKLLKL